MVKEDFAFDVLEVDVEFCKYKYSRNLVRAKGGLLVYLKHGWDWSKELF